MERVREEALGGVGLGLGLIGASSQDVFISRLAELKKIFILFALWLDARYN